jgi:hypothetical protein
MSKQPYSRYSSVLHALVYFTAFSTDSLAATLLETGGGSELITVEQQVLLPLAERPFLYFDFGFATEEQPQAQEFSDAFSISLRSEDGGAYTFLLTADVSGVGWAPEMAGGFQLEQNGIAREPIDFPMSGNNLPSQFAYRVSFAVPDPFVGERLDVIFDLFDNQNSLRSIGYVSDLTIVPEPRSWLIFVFGLAALGFRYRKFKES